MATKLYTIIMTVTSAPDREGMQDRSAGLVNSCGRTVTSAPDDEITLVQLCRPADKREHTS